MSRKRIFFFPGFGEDHRCFRNLEPMFNRDFSVHHVDYRPVLDRFPVWETSASTMARHLIEHFGIGPEEAIIGHSMGGYFGYAIATIQGNPVAMVGSFSNTEKIVRMTENKVFNYTMVASGLIKTPLMKWYISARTNNKQWLPEMLDIQHNFTTFSNTHMIKMLTLSYGEDLPPPLSPPLRIHAADDAVVRPPDEPYHEVPGGHFSIVFHPEEVYRPIAAWLPS